MSNKQKTVGDTTSITFPSYFKHYDSKQKIEVSKEMMELVNESFRKREFTHLVMTLLWEKTNGLEEKEASVLADIKKKLDSIHRDIKNRTFQDSEPDPVFEKAEADTDELADLLNNFKA